MLNLLPPYLGQLHCTSYGASIICQFSKVRRNLSATVACRVTRAHSSVARHISAPRETEEKWHKDLHVWNIILGLLFMKHRLTSLCFYVKTVEMLPKCVICDFAYRIIVLYVHLWQIPHCREARDFSPPIHKVRYLEPYESSPYPLFISILISSWMLFSSKVRSCKLSLSLRFSNVCV